MTRPPARGGSAEARREAARRLEEAANGDAEPAVDEVRTRCEAVVTFLYATFGEAPAHEAIV